MKKLTIIAVLVMLLALAMAASSTGPSVVFAAYTHGDFANNSKGCADCHITHAANAAFLLVDGPTQTDTCYFCHDSITLSSNYNIETATTRGTDTVQRPSYAGGFKQSPNPDNWIVGAIANNTSVHSVELSYQYGGSQTGAQVGGSIPGGTAGWSGTFKCGSCHNPHMGGRYPSEVGQPYKNPRLLRLRPLGAAVDKVVYMLIQYPYDAGVKTRQTEEYGKGWNDWCGACHDVFDTETNGGTENPDRTGSWGINNGSGVMKYRHKMGVTVNTTGFSANGVNGTSIQNGLPVPTDTNGSAAGLAQNKLNCLTCHRAHASSVTVSVGFDRFKNYTTATGGANTVLTGTGASALLRLPERDVCYGCHGAATANTWGGTGAYGTGW